MNKDIAQELLTKAEEVCTKYGNPDRKMNVYNETWAVDKVNPTSENTAVVIFKKSRGKKVIGFFYYIRMRESERSYWQYFLPTESHVFGMAKVVQYLQDVEDNNFPLNFPRVD